MDDVSHLVSTARALTERYKIVYVIVLIPFNGDCCHSAYFSPVASSPVVRRSDSPRVKIVQNGMDAGDASRVGPDHGVASNASSASQIGVLRGPATLQFRCGAVGGGAVNVVDPRIPSELLDAPIGDIEVRHDTRSNEKFAKAELNATVSNFTFHVDGFTRETDDFEIPSFVERVPDGDAPEGVLENSAIDAKILPLAVRMSVIAATAA